jgi:hypothetical protein
MAVQSIVDIGFDWQRTEQDKNRVIGYLREVRDTIKEINGMQFNGGSLAGLMKNEEALTKVQQQLNEVTQNYVKLQEQLAQQANNSAGAAKKQLDAFQQLQKEYKDAVASAKALGVQYGENSTQFKEAASNASLLKERIDAINKASKGAGTMAAPVDTGNVDKQLTAYEALNEQYQLALTHMREIGAALGIDSAEYQDAALKAGLLKQQLADINKIPKPAPVTTPVISTTNLPENDAAVAAGATGEAVSQLEKEEAAAAISAQAWADAQQQVIAVSTAANEAIVKEVTEYEALAQAVVATQAELDAINAAIKANATAFQQGLISEEKYVEENGKLIIQQTELRQSLAATRAEFTAQAKIVAGTSGAYDMLNARYREAQVNAKDLAVIYGIESKQAQEAAASAFALGQQLKNIDASTNQFNKNVGNYGGAITGAFSKAFGFIRQIAYILPGIGIAGIFSAIFDGIQQVTVALFSQVQAFDAIKEAHRDYVNVIEEGQKSSEKEIVNLQILEKVATDVNKPMQERLEAVHQMQTQYPAYLGNLSQEAILSGQAAGEIDKLSTALFQKAYAEAAANKAAELGIKNLDLQGKAAFLYNEQIKSLQKINELKKFGESSADAEIGADPKQALTDEENHLTKINKLLGDNRQQQIFNNTEIQRYINEGAKFAGVVQDLVKGGNYAGATEKFRSYLAQLLKAQQEGEDLLLQDEIKFRQSIADSSGFDTDIRMQQAKKASELRLQLIKQKHAG